MWLEPLTRALDQSQDPVCFFFRDDDAGWNDAALWQLLDVFDDHAIAIDLAVIPDALSSNAAQVLDARRTAAPHLLGLHQHGFRHLNHEPSGRKCEFGTTRGLSEQLADLRAGQKRLNQMLGPIDPIFTPPWNRCSDRTVECLRQLGFIALSRDVGASPPQTSLDEVPIHIDWCKYRQDTQERWGDLANKIARAVSTYEPIGIMLHHAAMDASDHARLGALLRCLRAHENARFSRLIDLLPSSSIYQTVCAPETQ